MWKWICRLMPGLDDPVVALSMVGGYWVMPITYSCMPHDHADPPLQESIMTPEEQALWALIEFNNTKERQLHGCRKSIRQCNGRR
jgi:hypothetical protein